MQSLGDPKQSLHAGVAFPSFQASYEGTIEVSCPRELFLGPSPG
jgi:hypothetical protein